MEGVTVYQLAVQIGYHQFVVIAACFAVRWSLADGASKDLGWRPLGLAMTAVLAGYIVPSALVFIILSAALVPLFAGRSKHSIVPLMLVGLFVLPPVSVAWQIGSLKLIGITAHDAIAVGAAFRIAVQGRNQSTRLDVPFFLLFVIIFLVQSNGTTETNKLRLLIQQCLIWITPYYVFSRGLTKKEDIQPFIVGLIYAGTIHASLLLFESLKGWPLYRLMVDRLSPEITAHIAVKLRGDTIRAGASFLEATSAAFALLACILPAVFSQTIFKSRARHAALLILLFAGLVVPQARNALVGLGAGLLVSSLAMRQRFQTIFRFSIAGFISVAMLAVITSRGFLEVLGLTSDGQVTVDYRSILWDEGVEIVAQHPIFGQPMPTVVAQLDHLRQGEGIVDFVNTYLWIALGAGLTGLLIVAIGLFWNVGRLWVLARGRDATVMLLRPFAGLAIANVIMLSFTSLGGRALTMILMTFAVGASWRAATLIRERATSRFQGGPPSVQSKNGLAKNEIRLPASTPTKPTPSD